MKTFSEISNDQAINFLMDQKIWRENLGIYVCDFWCGCFIDDVLVGVISMFEFKTTARIKTLYIHKEYQKRSIAKSLIEYLLFKNDRAKQLLKNKKKITVFSTEKSRPVFEKFGFKEVKFIEKNGDSFMEKELEENV